MLAREGGCSVSLFDFANANPWWTLFYIWNIGLIAIAVAASLPARKP